MAEDSKVDLQALAAAAAAVKPDDPASAFDLGRLLLQTGEAEQALPLLETAVRLDQTRAQHWTAYSSALIAVGRAQDALKVLASLGGRLPESHLSVIEAQAHARIVRDLIAQGRATETEAPLAQAVALAPAHIDVLATQAMTLSALGRHAEAEGPYRQVIAEEPGRAAIWSNLGATLASLHRNSEAEACYREALTLDPADANAQRNLGVLMRTQGRLDEVRETSGGVGQASIVLPAALALRPISASRTDIAVQRQGYAEGLRLLGSQTEPLVYQGETFAMPTFYLAYQALDDRPLMEATAAVLKARIAGLDYVSDQIRAPTNRQKICLAIVSDNLNNHTIGHLYRGIVAHLDRSQFEVVVVHGARSRQDTFRDSIDAVADRSVNLTGGLTDQHGQIEALQPDIIFYPDIGMSPQSYFLAHARLAPVQATAWGHPDTTGLETLDYFISSEVFEPPSAGSHYTEQLVRLPRIPCFFDPPALPADPMSREQLGLPTTGTLYGCPQTLFKLHPDFDAVLAAIAEGDTEGHIVLPASDQPTWREALEARWRATWPILLDRVHWTPRIDSEPFLAQLAHFDVLLDPLHFGSGYTFYLAMAQGVPMVTWPGEFARGRVVAGAYRQMGVGSELVADSPTAYAAVALALGADPPARAALRRRLSAAAKAHLFSDHDAVRQLGEVFVGALEAARQGKRLASVD